jgi:hypothetical protein
MLRRLGTIGFLGLCRCVLYACCCCCCCVVVFGGVVVVVLWVDDVCCCCCCCSTAVSKQNISSGASWNTGGGCNRLDDDCSRSRCRCCWFLLFRRLIMVAEDIQKTDPQHHRFSLLSLFSFSLTHSYLDGLFWRHSLLY